MLFKSMLMGAASGKVRALVASHNSGGQYFRGLTIPTNPRTTLQIQRRATLSSMAKNWTLRVTEDGRKDWNFWASQITFINRVGDAIHISGFAAFMKINLFASLVTPSSLTVDAPLQTTLAAFTQPTLSITAGDNTGSLTFGTNAVTDSWAGSTGGFLALFVSAPQGPGRTFFNGPYQLAGTVLGDDTTPPTSPATITIPTIPEGGAVEGSQFFWRANVYDFTNGVIGTPVGGVSVVAAAAMEEAAATAAARKKEKKTSGKAAA